MGANQILVCIILIGIVGVIYFLSSFFQKKWENKNKNSQEQVKQQLCEQQQPNEELQPILDSFFSDSLPVLLKKSATVEKPMLISAIEKSIDAALDDNFLSKDEEQRISDFMDHFGILTDDLSSASLAKITQAALLRDLFAGEVNPRVTSNSLPFNLMKKEILIWAFSPVGISEIKTVKGWEGGNSGFSFRVMKGVYWRVGATKGKRIERQELRDLGDGIVAVTNYCLYMKTGNFDSMRIKLEKIISVDADSKNVIIFREGARSNPVCFNTPDAWFLANIIQNATNWQ